MDKGPGLPSASREASSKNEGAASAEADPETSCFQAERSQLNILTKAVQVSSYRPAEYFRDQRGVTLLDL